MSTATLYESYETIIGLEVHCQLLTQAKAFSPESAAFGASPNSHVDPVSLGHPGTLPVLNEQVVRHSIRMGLATHCQIAPRSVFARKHYFYPDLPKGYQISQYETPICYDGYVDITADGEDGQTPSRRVGLTRIHMEEDAGKSLHDQHPHYSLLDYNRCGVPLVEIVSEPDLRSAREAYLYMQKIRQVVRWLGICDGNMEEGSLRCDANVSVRQRGSQGYGTKTEIKNLNSFRHVERAIEYEALRQIRLIERGDEVVQETLLWDADAQETRSMRSKEEAHDYRYFPDPDLAPVVVSEELLEEVRKALPEMPDARRQRFELDLGLPTYDASLLTEERSLADYFEEVLAELASLQGGGNYRAQAKAVSNFVMTEVLRVLKERDLDVQQLPVGPGRLAALVDLRMDEELSSSGAQELFEAMLESDEDPKALAKERNVLQVSDTGALGPVVTQVLDEYPKQVATYLGGKEGLLGFFIGQVMRTFEGAPDPQVVRKMLTEQLEARRNG